MVVVLKDAENYAGAVSEEILMPLGLEGRTRSDFPLMLLGNEYLHGFLKLAVKRTLCTRITAAANHDALASEQSPSPCRTSRVLVLISTSLVLEASTCLLRQVLKIKEPSTFWPPLGSAPLALESSKLKLPMWASLCNKPPQASKSKNPEQPKTGCARGHPVSPSQFAPPEISSANPEIPPRIPTLYAEQNSAMVLMRYTCTLDFLSTTSCQHTVQLCASEE